MKELPLTRCVFYFGFFFPLVISSLFTMEIGIEKKFDLFTVQTSREAFFGEKTQATKWCFLLSQRSNGNKYKKVLFFLKRKEREKKKQPVFTNISCLRVAQ